MPNNVKLRNDQIDRLLQVRQDSLANYSNAMRELLRMGVRIGHQTTGEIEVPPHFQSYIEQFNLSNLDFEWIARYKDGSVLMQFDGQDEHNFGHIDQTRLESIALVSNFTWSTDNEEKRVIVRLNMENGLFDFMNGFTPQDVRAALMEPIPGPKKLILFTKKRQSMTGSMNPRAELQEFLPILDEVFYYYQYVLGFETPDGKKRTILIQPNGEVELFDS